jgi:hypothetical protein
MKNLNDIVQCNINSSPYELYQYVIIMNYDKKSLLPQIFDRLSIINRLTSSNISKIVIIY